MDDISRVIAWSMQHMAAKKWPTTREDGEPWKLSDSNRKKHAGKDLQLAAVLSEVRGDWKMMKDTFRFPGWNSNEGICWMCNCTKETMRDCSATAPWRMGRCSHFELLARIDKKGKGCSPLFSCPCLTGACFKVDWLHAVDIGVAADFIGNVFYMIMRKRQGSQTTVASEMFVELQQFYRRELSTSRLDNLSVTMIKQPKKSPKLRGKAGEVRDLVKFAEELAHNHLSRDDQFELTVRQATTELVQMYAALSRDTESSNTMRDHCRKFCVLYSALECRSPDKKLWRMKPKVHMLQELAEMGVNGSNPSLFWTYRDEDVGGSIARLARRRGGANTAFSTAQSTLDRFVTNNPVPRL